MRLLISILLFIVIFSSIILSLPQEITILEYGLYTCPHCREQKEVLSSLGFSFRYIELQGNETNVMEYLWIYDNFVGDERFVPLVVIIFNETPKMVVVGGGDKDYWLGLIDKASSLQGVLVIDGEGNEKQVSCLLYTSPSPRDGLLSRMPSSA